MKLFPQSKKRRVALLVMAAVIVCLLSTEWIVSHFVDLEGARTQVAAVVSRKLHRRVEIGRLSVGFLWASLRQIKIYDRREFGGDAFVSIPYASASVQPLKLLRGRLAIAQIKARRPRVVIKRNAAGELNIADLLSGAKDQHKGSGFRVQGSGTAAETGTATAKADKSEFRGFPAVDVESVALSRATVKFLDEENKSNYEVAGLDVACRGSLGGNPIKVDGAHIGFQRLSIEVRGEVTRDLKRGWIALEAGDVDLMDFKPYLPFLSKFETGAWVIQGFSLKSKINNGVLCVDDLSCRPSGGSLKATGKLWVEHGKPGFIVDANVEGIQLDRFLWQTRADRVSFGGSLYGKCSLSSIGVLWDDLKQELLGSAELRVTGGRFQNKVFIAIGEAAYQFLGVRKFDEYRANARGTFRISDGKIQTSDLCFDSGLLDVYMAGAGYLTLEGDLRLPKVVLRAGDDEDSLQATIKIKGSVNKPKLDFEWKSLRKTLIGK